jgi:hypothetical protein
MSSEERGCPSFDPVFHEDLKLQWIIGITSLCLYDNQNTHKIQDGMFHKISPVLIAPEMEKSCNREKLLSQSFFSLTCLFLHDMIILLGRFLRASPTFFIFLRIYKSRCNSAKSVLRFFHPKDREMEDSLW